MATYSKARKTLRHTGLLPVVNIDGALHRLALMLVRETGELRFVDTLGWQPVEVDITAPVFFTRRRAENAAMRLGLTAWANRSATRLGLVTGQTFAEYAKEEGRFTSIEKLDAYVVQVITQEALRKAAA